MKSSESAPDTFYRYQLCKAPRAEGESARGTQQLPGRKGKIAHVCNGTCGTAGDPIVLVVLLGIPRNVC
ncbi:hypothetical protein WA026_005989 [Henosepilachna vigintioctopunctata]|uniref:Uncharacterized protein n=1 Tax=Henosepilachna vigintioctopunctata TaxID=420089 RepID=A0AAW1U3T3_9CUCU